MSKRTFKEDKLAKIYDTEVVPIWSRRFGKMMLRDLTVPHKAMVLDVNCGSGYPALEILKRMDEQGRIIAIDTSSPLLDEARTKAGKLSGKRIFFRSEASLPKLPFADDVYDLVVANAGLQQLDDPEPAVRECARVAKVGGQVIATYPLAGTFGEFYDLFREVLIKGDFKDGLDRLDAYLTRYPPLEQAVAWFEDAGLEDVQAEFETFTLLFKSSREFFFAPIIEYGPLSSWKTIAGKGQQMQDVFWQTKASIDAYFHGSSFSVSVFTGCVRGRKAMREPSVSAPAPTDQAGAQKGVRASSPSNPRRGSRPSGKDVPGGEPSELPDAPSDEVEALSGSWPVPEPERTREPTGTGSSQVKWEISRELHPPIGGARDSGDVGDFGDEPTTDRRDRQVMKDLRELAQTPRETPLPSITPFPAPDLDREIEEDDAPAPIPDEIEPDTGERDLPGAVPGSGANPEPRMTESGVMELGSGEFELVEGTGSVTARPGTRRVGRRPDDPDDPDIL